jgi:RNA polymerase sigma-70 factor (ECF subfamily)
LESRLETSEISNATGRKARAHVLAWAPFRGWVLRGPQGDCGGPRLFFFGLSNSKFTFEYVFLHKQDFNTAHALQALVKGREDGLEFFFNQHYAALCFFSNSLLNDQCLAEEITSEAFIKLWEHRRQFSIHGNVKAWLYSTVRNACIDHLRKAKRIRINIRGLQTAHTIEQSVLHTIIEAETIKHIIHTLHLLPPKCRQIFKLFYLHGMSYDEIAKQLNLSRLTVRNQKLKAQRLLKKMLAGSVTLLFFFFV